MSDPIRVLTVKELAAYLRVHQSTVYRLLKQGRLPAFRVGSDWRFNVETIDRWRLERSGMAFDDEGADVGKPVVREPLVARPGLSPRQVDSSKLRANGNAGIASRAPGVIPAKARY